MGKKRGWWEFMINGGGGGVLRIENPKQGVRGRNKVGKHCSTQIKILLWLMNIIEMLFLDWTDTLKC